MSTPGAQHAVIAALAAGIQDPLGNSPRDAGAVAHILLRHLNVQAEWLPLLIRDPDTVWEQKGEPTGLVYDRMCAGRRAMMIAKRRGSAVIVKTAFVPREASYWPAHVGGRLYRRARGRG